jgi:K+-transporting ATPase KdpF subunit
MLILHILGAVLAGTLFVYLFLAMLMPEKFS